MQHTILIPNAVQTPLGRWIVAGHIAGGRGVVPARPLRVYGSYAVMCVLRGEGAYGDANGVRRLLAAGDVVFVFPEFGHTYGTGRGRRWDEMYVTFDGPVFDLWRETGLLDPRRPVASVPDPGWPVRLRALLTDVGRPGGQRSERIGQMQRFLGLLSDLLPNEAEEKDIPPAAPPLWLVRACGLLETDLGIPVDLAEGAETAGLSYESFRKQFARATGVSPARYRLQCRIEAARQLLRYSPQMTNRQVAEALGFSDEFHFSRRFKELTGVTPKAFRAGEGG